MSLPDPTPEKPVRDDALPPAPPQPSLTGMLLDEKPRYTARDWTLFALGTLLGLATLLTLCLGTIVLTVVFFVAKPPRSPLLRGIGLGIAIAGLIVLGLLTVCLFALGAGNMSVH